MIGTTFSGLDPIEIRYKKAKDVMRVAKRILRRNQKIEKKSKIKADNRKPAGDNWF